LVVKTVKEVPNFFVEDFEVSSLFGISLQNVVVRMIFVRAFEKVDFFLIFDKERFI